MTDIKFLTEPDETGLGRIVVDGKFYGLPSGAVAALARSFTAHDIAVSDEIERNREDIAELVGILQSAMRHGGLLHMAVARAAITEHSTTIKEQA